MNSIINLFNLVVMFEVYLLSFQLFNKNLHFIVFFLTFYHICCFFFWAIRFLINLCKMLLKMLFPCITLCCLTVWSLIGMKGFAKKGINRKWLLLISWLIDFQKELMIYRKHLLTWQRKRFINLLKFYKLFNWTYTIAFI